MAVAVATLLVAASLRIWTPREHMRELSTVVYLMTLLQIASLVLFSGQLLSPFSALLAIAIAFSGYFGVAGYLTGLIVLAGLGVWQFSHDQALYDIILSGLFFGLLPLLISAVLWSKDAISANEDTTEDRSYRELASQLSQVAGKSDVVINAIADGVLALNAKGHIELINPAAQRIIGWGKQDALNLDYKSVVKLIDAKNAEVTDINNPIEKALHDNKSFESDVYSLLTNSGKNILVSLVASPIGQPGSGVIVVFRDITSEKAEERQQAEFISTASHEMRTPVASIEGYLGLALNPNTAQVDVRARDYINKAHASAEHLGRLFQDLLDVSKADDGRLANTPKVVDVVPYISEIAAGLKPKAEQKGLRFIYKPIPDDSPDRDRSPLAMRNMTPVYYANVDNDHLREIVSNLIENAIKYTPSGDIVIDVGGDSEHIDISVADTGLGIPKEDQSHLFQKFYRVDSSETREIGGTGLGLYLCRRLAETIGGRLWVESEFKRGSTFHLELPRIGHEEATKLIEQASIEAERLMAASTQVSPVPVSQPLSYPQASVPPSQQPASTNIPLSSIEANPGQYIQPRDGNVTIPNRPQ